MKYCYLCKFYKYFSIFKAMCTKKDTPVENYHDAQTCDDYVLYVEATE